MKMLLKTLDERFIHNRYLLKVLINIMFIIFNNYMEDILLKPVFVIMFNKLILFLRVRLYIFLSILLIIN